MKAKVLITVSGGIVTAVATNLPECNFLVIDFDLQDEGQNPVMDAEEQHETFEDGKAYLLFDGFNPSEMEASDELKRIKF